MLLRWCPLPRRSQGVLSSPFLPLPRRTAACSHLSLSCLARLTFHLLPRPAGDCRAVLDRGSEAAALSRDHTAALEDERLRVQAQGGTVSFQHGSWRVGDCGLQVSRCIGDFDHKGRGLTAEPEVTHVRLRPSDTLLVVGTDGLWDAVGNEEAVGLVRDTVKDPMLCAKRLVIEALARGSNDNVSAAVMFLRPVSTLERVYGEGVQAFRATATVYGSRARGGAADLSHGQAADELRDTY
jgi:hypothetical protein